MQWADVSATYAGVFFRVEGGGSAAFGQTQQENAPHLTKVEYGYFNNIDGINRPIETNSDQTSEWIRSGYYTNTISNPISTALRFTLSGGEVRPNNMAVKVWKRTG